MAHIHTEPRQHDLTTSAYIIRNVDGKWLCLAHMHKKLNKLLQVGGHVELHETPWAALAHEIAEESGYRLSELELLQPKTAQPMLLPNIAHPIPASFNTHCFSSDHYHTDLGYAFVAKNPPEQPPGENESTDLRWLTLEQLEACVQNGQAYADTYKIYKNIIDNILPNQQLVNPINFSLGGPIWTKVDDK